PAENVPEGLAALRVPVELARSGGFPVLLARRHEGERVRPGRPAAPAVHRGRRPEAAAGGNTERGGDRAVVPVAQPGGPLAGLDRVVDLALGGVDRLLQAFLGLLGLAPAVPELDD